MRKYALIFVLTLFLGRVHAQSADYTPMHWAAAQGYVEMIKVLVDKSYDLNGKDEDGFTPLHYATLSGQIEAVRFLVENGADIYAVNLQNYTPLTLAAKTGHQDIVDFLFVKMRSVRMDELKAQIEKDRVETDLAQAAKARYEAEGLRAKAESWMQEARRWRDEAEKWNKEAAQWKEKQVILDRMVQERVSEALKSQKVAEDKYQAERAAKLEAYRYAEEVAAAQRAQAQAQQAAEAAVQAQRAGDQVIENLVREIEKQGGNSNVAVPMDEVPTANTTDPAANVADAYYNDMAEDGGNYDYGGDNAEAAMDGLDGY